jgi:hypothetical protein
MHLLFLAIMISLTKPTPLPQAVAQLSARTPIGSMLKSADWQRVPLALREAAFFSAQVESARVLQFAKDKLDTAITLGREQVANGTAFVDRSSFIGDMRKMLADMGYAPEPEKSGGLQDLSSRGRLGLIFGMNVASAQGFADWKTGQDADLLDAFPAQELVRVEGRMEPRDWQARWQDAGGRLFDGRMIALKTDGIWTRISRFGRPWPPFDFNSGMGLDDIDRSEAEDLGVLARNAEVKPVEKDFMAGMQASVDGIDPRLQTALKTIFGDQVSIENGAAKWIGGAQ